MDQLNTDAWIGQETVSQGGMSEHQAAQAHATLGEGHAPRHGDPLPLLWHWCAFPTTAPNDALGRDGHIRGSRLLPPVHLPRRMWAGGALSFHKPLYVGEQIERRSRVRSVIEKSGSTGPIVLVTVDHALYGDRGLAVEERQDIVYLNIPDNFVAPEKRAIPAPTQEAVDTPETLLFRYSALTFNTHRIHYDLRYTQEVEHYPALVVHGPLQATLLMRAAIRAQQGRTPLFFDFRGVHPMFAGQTCDIALAETDEGMRLWSGQDGHQCMVATATWEGTQ
ncbi:MAG: MaoC family dehydratase N-terminal domain-containing protein [Tateyamaria sp.]